MKRCYFFPGVPGDAASRPAAALHLQTIDKVALSETLRDLTGITGVPPIRAKLVSTRGRRDTVR